MPVLLDTSFLVAFDNAEDVHHNRARQLWLEIERGDYGQWFISDYVFDELVAVAMRKSGKRRAVILGDSVKNSIPIINIDSHLFEEAWRVFTATRLNFTLTDCTHLVLLR
ncbi:type II toxin-antitoxin system VapC family toxin, partial [Candidatus Woesearchaeota archaeon]|nr:type II toxin-antitoxin system VapC family toxin [Candidatus Woesearchaeota archaeon]